MKFATCHLDRQHYAKGQCKSCYGTQRYGMQNNHRAKRFYHVSKALHQIKWLTPLYIYARNFKHVSKANYGAFLKYKNMLTIQFKRLHDADYDKWLDSSVEVFTRAGHSSTFDLQTVKDTLIKPTNDSSE